MYIIPRQNVYFFKTIHSQDRGQALDSGRPIIIPANLKTDPKIRGPKKILRQMPRSIRPSQEKMVNSAR